jgi:hypothetical protein
MLSGLAGYAAAETITTADQMFNENESYDKGDPPPPLPPTSLENQGLEIVPFPRQVELPWELEGYDLINMPGPWILPGPTLEETKLTIYASEESKGFTGGTSSTVFPRRKIRGLDVRVDVEYPTGESTGNVNIHINNDKIYLDSVDDLQLLPSRLRKNTQIRRAVEKAFGLLERY